MTDKIIFFKVSDDANEDWFQLPYNEEEIKACKGIHNYVQSKVDKHNIFQFLGSFIFRDFKFSTFSDVVIVKNCE